MALKWVFGADTGPFRQGLASMRSDVKAFGGSIKGMLAGAFTIGSITSLLDHFGRIQDLADRFGTSATTIQKAGNAAELAGSDMETLGRGLTILTKNLADAENGGTETKKMFDALGISVEEFKRLTPEDQLVELSRGYTTATDRGQALNANRPAFLSRLLDSLGPRLWLLLGWQFGQGTGLGFYGWSGGTNWCQIFHHLSGG